MFVLLVVLLFSAAVLGTATGITYEIFPHKDSIITLVTKHKALTYFALCYPIIYISALLLFGNSVNVPKPKYHALSTFIFMTGHMLLAILAIVASFHLYKRRKSHLIFLITNSLAGLAYTGTTLILLQMWWHNS